MKYDLELISSEESQKIKVDLTSVDMKRLSKAELIGLYFMNEISEKKLKELISIDDTELESLAKIILNTI